MKRYILRNIATRDGKDFFAWYSGKQYGIPTKLTGDNMTRDLRYATVLLDDTAAGPVSPQAIKAACEAITAGQPITWELQEHN